MTTPLVSFPMGFVRLDTGPLAGRHIGSIDSIHGQYWAISDAVGRVLWTAQNLGDAEDWATGWACEVTAQANAVLRAIEDFARLSTRERVTG